MAKINPIHHGPMMPLALMALFALMIPVIYISNSDTSIKNSNAMRMRKPTNEPVYMGDPMMTPNPTSTAMPKATSGSMMKY